MSELPSYQGEVGLRAVLRALENVRLMLQHSSIDTEQVAGYLGCINLHMCHMLGVTGELEEQLASCGGLLCPKCKGFVGLISNLSSSCQHCGAALFPSAGEGLP